MLEEDCSLVLVRCNLEQEIEQVGYSNLELGLEHCS